MYVCLCNAITDRDVRGHTAGDDCSVAMVYRSLGCAPQCGKCVPFVRRLLRQPETVIAVEQAGGDD